MISCYSDGACRNNGKQTSEASIGVSIQKDDGKDIMEILKHSEYLGKILDIGPRIDNSNKVKVVMTNNTSEYLAFIKGIEMLIENNILENITFFVDSKLVCEQINSNWKVKHPLLKKLHTYAIKLLTKLKNWEIKHVLRNLNKRADELANDAFIKQV